MSYSSLGPRHTPALHSFPTRRSSDLSGAPSLVTWAVTAPRPPDSRWRVAPRWKVTPRPSSTFRRSEEHTSELQSPDHLVCSLLLEKKKRTALRHHPQSYTRLHNILYM